jgi:predicted ATPase
VVEICARLDGLPLALELAAARIQLLPPQAMLSRLGDRLKLLTGGARNLPERQRTLRNAIAWSYEMLDEGEKSLFARLAVFSGGSTLEGIEAVCDPQGDLPVDALEGVSSLLDKSLLRQEEGQGAEPRLMMLETIREFASQRLEESGEAEQLRKSHADYCIALAEAWWYRIDLSELDHVEVFSRTYGSSERGFGLGRQRLWIDEPARAQVGEDEPLYAGCAGRLSCIGRR